MGYNILIMLTLTDTAVLFGLAAAIPWGFADVFIGRSTKKVGSMSSAILVNGLGAVAFSLVYVFFLYSSDWPYEGITYAFIGSAFFGAAQAAFFKAMRLGPVGLVSSISNTYPLVVLAIGALVLSVSVSAQHIAGIVCIVVGVMLASGLFEKHTHVGKGPLVAMLAALGWGGGLSFIAHAFSVMSWQNVFMIQLFTAVVVLLILTPFIKGKEKVSRRLFVAGVGLPMVWAATILQLVGMVAFYFGLSLQPRQAAVIVAAASCYPALTIFLGIWRLGEKLPFIPILGGVLGIAGVVVLALA